MRSFDCGSKLVGGDEVVNLEIVHALIEPEIHCFRSVIWASQLVRLQNPTAFTLDIRPRRMDLRPRRFARINVPLDLEIGVRLKRAGGADRRYPGREIQPQEAVRHLAINSVAHGIKHVIVHTDETGDYAVAVQIEHVRILRDARPGGTADRLNLAVRQHDGLIVFCRTAGSINHAHMLQRNDRRINFDELFDVRGQSLCACCRAPDHRQ